MNDRSSRIYKLLKNAASRASYIRAKLNVLIPSQIRALRLHRGNITQKQLAELAQMVQPRISAMERPGETNFNIETLVRLAAAFKVGLKVEFVPFSEMLAWENNYSQDAFDPAPIEQDRAFLNPVSVMPVIQTHWVPTQYEFAWERFVRGARGSYAGFIGSAGAAASTAQAYGLGASSRDFTYYLEHSNPNPQLADIQATPIFQLNDLIAASPSMQ